jgi:hypothetical protein
MEDRTEFLKDLYENEIKKILAMKAKFVEGMKDIELNVRNDLDPVDKHALVELHKQIGLKYAQIMDAYDKSLKACQRGLQNLRKPAVQEFLAAHLPDEIAKEVHKENNQQEAQQQVETLQQKQQDTLALTAISYNPYNGREAALDYQTFKTNAQGFAQGNFRPVLAIQQIRQLRDEFRNLFENLFISNRAQRRFAMTNAKDQPFIHILVIRNQPAQGNPTNATLTRSCIVTPTEWQETIHTALETERLGERTLVGAYAIPANRFDPMCLDSGNWDDKHQLEHHNEFERLIVMNKFFLGWQHFLYTDPQKEYLKTMMVEFESNGLLDAFLEFLKTVAPKSHDLILGIKKERDDAIEKEKAARQAELDKMKVRARGSVGSPSIAASAAGLPPPSSQHNVNYQTHNASAGSSTAHDVAGMPPPRRTQNPSRLLSTVPRGPMSMPAPVYHPVSAALHSAAAAPQRDLAPRPPSPEPQTTPSDAVDGDDRYPVMEPVSDDG